MLNVTKSVALGLVYLFLQACSSNSPPAKKPEVTETLESLYEDKRVYKNLDTEYATKIVNGEFGVIMRKSFQILTLESTQEEKEITIYWRDLAMLFLGVEAEHESPLEISPEAEKERWQNIPKDLQYALTKKLIGELNTYIKKDDDSKHKQSEISQLRQDLWTLTQKQQKLEQLLNDLEKVK